MTCGYLIARGERRPSPQQNWEDSSVLETWEMPRGLSLGFKSEVQLCLGVPEPSLLQDLSTKDLPMQYAMAKVQGKVGEKKFYSAKKVEVFYIIGNIQPLASDFKAC